MSNPLHSTTDLEIELRFEKSFDRWLDIYQELKDMGREASPLVALIIERIEDGSFPYVATNILDLYLATEDERLLELLRETGQLGISDEIRLFSAGEQALEDKVLQVLYEGYADDANVWISGILDALGTSGTAKALPVLDYVEGRLSPLVKERRFALEEAQDSGNLDKIKPFLGKIGLQIVEDRVVKARKAIQAIRNRATS